MTTLTAAPTRTSGRTATVGAALLALGCIALAGFDFLTTTSDGKFQSAVDYWYTADMFPMLIGLFLLLAGLRAVQRGRDGKLGTVSFAVTTVALVAVAVDGVATLVTKDPMALGPVYLLGTFVSIIGLVLFAVAAIRARVLPWWVGVALAITWTVGGLVGDDGPLGFPGSGLLLAAAGIAAAAVANRTGAAD